ncbi:MAG: exodeoxyribonuclease VII small subunit [Erysipelotrichaceae bacterium]|jgi:exodeoxyribonuclease VII small subunit|nr:exodeoxyribonuclease VII small subunit [Erysipelotrichaceae bacterium]
MAKEGKFEQQMNKLRDIVDRLEKGDIGLDESIGLYEEGLKLSRSLKKQLDSFEEKIDELGRSDEQ